MHAVDPHMQQCPSFRPPHRQEVVESSSPLKYSPQVRYQKLSISSELLSACKTGNYSPILKSPTHVGFLQNDSTFLPNYSLKNFYRLQTLIVQRTGSSKFTSLTFNSSFFYWFCLSKFQTHMEMLTCGQKLSMSKMKVQWLSRQRLVERVKEEF